MKKDLSRALISLLFFAVISACGGAGGGTSSGGDSGGDYEDAALTAELRALVVGLDPATLRSRALPSADDPLVLLGRELFFSKSLSINGDVACASCHDPRLAGTDQLSLPVGVGAHEENVIGPGRRHDGNYYLDPKANGGPNVGRNSPTTFNIAFYDVAMFWDGRVESVEFDGSGYRRVAIASDNGSGTAIRTPDSQFKGPDPDAGSNLTAAQARFPVTSTEEMKGFSSEAAGSRYAIRRAVAETLRSVPEWEEQFRTAFNDYVSTSETLMDYNNIAFALGEYQRSQIALDNPFFRFLGGENEALTAAQKRGAIVFFKPTSSGGAGCNRCHSGEHFTDEQFYAFATPQIGRGKNVAQKDFGRYNVTRTRSDLHRFRTPSLLNVELTHPYMHAGSLADLKTAVRWHIEPQQALNTYDFSLTTLPQLDGLGVNYSGAADNTQDAVDSYFDQFIYSSTKYKVNFPALNDQAISDVSEFLLSLTDPCLNDIACVSKWLPDFSEPSPDGQRLIPELRLAFNNDEVLPEPEPDDVSSPIGNSPDLGDVPVYQSVGCTETNVTDPILEGTHSFFKRTELVTGLSYHRRFTSSAWGEFLTSFNSLVNTGSVAVADIDGDCDADAVLDIGNEHGPIVLINNNGQFSDAANNYGLNGIDDAPSLAMADLNGDGWPDLLIGNMLTDSPSVWFNNGQGRFVRQEDSGFHVLRKTLSSAFYDVDNDGDLDVFLAHWDVPEAVEENHLWLNNGHGYFSAAPSSWGFSGKIGDRDFTFTPAFADFNGDHIADLASTSDFLRTRVYQGKADQSFVDVTNDGILNDENGMGSALGDFDNDGDLDWFVSSIYDAEVMSGEEPVTEGNWGSTGNRLYRNDSAVGSTIVFSDVTTSAGVRDGAWAWGACMKDFNNDGWLDIYQVNGYGMDEAEIYPDEQYLFTLLAPMGITGYSSIDRNVYPSFADFSAQVKDYVESLPDFFLNINQHINGWKSFNDMLPDLERLYVAAGLLNHGGDSWEEFVNQKARFFINNQDGTFTEKAMESLVASRSQGRGISCSDFDRDGDIDIFIVNNVGRPEFYENRVRGSLNSKDNFISLSLRVSGTNAVAIGSKVWLTAAGKTQYREMRLENNFISTNSPELHFGLADAASIDEIRIRWPGGSETVLNSVDANQFLQITAP